VFPAFVGPNYETSDALLRNVAAAGFDFVRPRPSSSCCEWRRRDGRARNIFGRGDILGRGKQGQRREQLDQKYDGPLKCVTPQQDRNTAETPN
jgi:hypothetical protein